MYTPQNMEQLGELSFWTCLFSNRILATLYFLLLFMSVT